MGKRQGLVEGHWEEIRAFCFPILPLYPQLAGHFDLWLTFSPASKESSS